MSLSTAADNINFGTEIMAGLFTTQAVLLILLGVATFQNIQFKKQEITQKKETTFKSWRMFENEITSKCLCKKYHNFFPPYRFKPQIDVEILL